MIEALVAQWLEDNTTLVLGQDLWLNSPPATTRDGVSVQFLFERNNFDKFRIVNINILIRNKDYTQCTGTAQTILDLLSAKRGYDGETWALSGEISWSKLGMDEFERYVQTLYFDVIYCN